MISCAVKFTASRLRGVTCWIMCRYGRLRLRSRDTSSRLTLLSVTDRDSGVYRCRHQLDTDQLTIRVLTTADQQRHNGNSHCLYDDSSWTLKPVSHPQEICTRNLHEKFDASSSQSRPVTLHGACHVPDSFCAGIDLYSIACKKLVPSTRLTTCKFLVKFRQRVSPA